MRERVTGESGGVRPKPSFEGKAESGKPERVIHFEQVPRIRIGSEKAAQELQGFFSFLLFCFYY